MAIIKNKKRLELQQVEFKMVDEIDALLECCDTKRLLSCYKYLFGETKLYRKGARLFGCLK